MPSDEYTLQFNPHQQRYEIVELVDVPVMRPADVPHHLHPDPVYSPSTPRTHGRVHAWLTLEAVLAAPETLTYWLARAGFGRIKHA